MRKLLQAKRGRDLMKEGVTLVETGILGLFEESTGKLSWWVGYERI